MISSGYGLGSYLDLGEVGLERGFILMFVL